MEEKFVLTNATVISILDDIRKPNGNKKSNTKSFEDIVPIVWKGLGLKGTPNPAALEELLVNLILRLYDVEKTENNEKMRKTAQNRDISLLMFGLLDGYYHTEEKNGKRVNVLSEERYERYLNDGDFIELDYPGEGSYQEIKIKDKERKTKSKSAQPRPLNKLTKIAGVCRVEIGEKLFELIRDKSYKEYMGGMREKDNAETLIDLPKPYYTLENFPPMEISPELGLIDSPDEERTDKTHPEPKKHMLGILRSGIKKSQLLILSNGIEKIQLLILISGITIVCVILALTVYNHSGSEGTVFSGDVSVKEHEALEVDSIEILNKNIYLAPGTDAYLEMNIDPDSVQREDLEYGSSDRTVVTTEKHHIIAHEGWREDADHNIVITVQGGLMAEDKAYVTVINPDGTDIHHGAKGDGASEDDSSGLPD